MRWTWCSATMSRFPLLSSTGTGISSAPIPASACFCTTSRILGFGSYSSHVLTTLRREAVVHGDRELLALHDELAAYPGVEQATPEPSGPVLPVRLRTPLGVLSFFTTAARFGTAADVTLAELTIESFFPADKDTAERVRRATVHH